MSIRARVCVQLIARQVPSPLDFCGSKLKTWMEDAVGCATVSSKWHNLTFLTGYRRASEAR
jgi:hypothetical protein